MNREIVANAVLIFTSVLVVTAGLELSLIFGVVGSSYPETDFCTEPDRARQFHEEYGWSYVPNHAWQQKWTRQGDWEVYRTNAEGFRDTYNTGDRSAIVLGDSLTEGRLVGNNETYTHLLDRWASDTAFRNYGMGGYGTAEELAVYQNVSTQYEHNLVIVGYYKGNDMVNNVDYDNDRRPQYEVENGTLVQVHEPERPASKSNTNQNDQPEPSSDSGGLLSGGGVQAVQDYLRENTQTYPYLVPRIRTVLQYAGVIEKDVRTVPTGSERARQRRVTRLLMREIVQRADEQNATVLIVGIPASGEIDANQAAHFPPTKETQSYWHTQDRMLRNIAANHSNAYHLNLTPPLKRASREGRLEWDPDDEHLTESGHRVVAKSIFDWIEENTTVQARSAVDFGQDYEEDPACS